MTTHAPASAAFGSSFSVAATGGGSGNPVTFSSAGACTNVGALFTMTSGTGTCSVKYDQAGSADYDAAPQVVESVSAAKAGQTISVTTHAPASAAFGSGFSVAATGGGERQSGDVLELRRLHERRGDVHDDERHGDVLRCGTTRPETRTTTRRRRSSSR